MLSAPRGSIRVRFSPFRANLSRTSCAGGILRLWALYEHVLRRLLRPHSSRFLRPQSPEGESARGFEASSALTYSQHRAQRSRRPRLEAAACRTHRAVGGNDDAA